jgi:hypothetical protein
MAEMCMYCGSPQVMDDAWWCDRPECWKAYYRECEEVKAYQERTPLTATKARIDLMRTKACVWGPPAMDIELAASMIVSRSVVSWRRS